jgi:hypothetical protein
MSKHIVRLVLFLVVLPIVGCALLACASFTVGIPFHDCRLNQYGSAFRQIQHPSGTSLVKSKELVSRSETNGACAYFAGQLRRYTGSRQDIEAFYADQVNNKPFSQDFKLLFIENGELPVGTAAYKWLLPYGVNQISDWQVSSSDLQGNLYLVYFSGVGDAYFDYRCK